MLRSSHCAPKTVISARGAFALALALWLPACSVSMPKRASSDAPATTGSIATPVEVQKPVPPSLAYSDANKIGQAAAAALWQANPPAGTDWINAATGSSGTVETSAAATSVDGAPDCRSFESLVTSIGGVHSYRGKVCRAGNGPSVVQYEP